MNKTDFFLNLLEYSHSKGFSFLTPDQAFEQPKKLSTAQQTKVAMISGVFFGALGGISTGYTSKINKEQTIADFKRMSEHCDLVGLNLSGVVVQLRLGLDADDLTDEAIVDRCTLIQERAHDFRNYALSLFTGKMSTHAEVIMAFSSHKRAKEFIDRSAKKCKHWSYWKKVMTHPWVADLEDEEMTGFQFDLGHMLAKQLKSGLFHTRSETHVA